MTRTATLLAVLPMLLIGCASAPSAPNPPTVVTVCPRIPDLPELDPETKAALERDYTERMDNFLLGRLPTHPDYRLRSEPASPGTGGLKRP